MTKYILAIVCLFLAITAMAQNGHTNKSTIIITGGVAIPGSEFADATGIDVKDYVDRGLFTSVSFKRDISRYFAAGFTGGFAKNELNEKAIAEASSTRIETVPWTSTFVVTDFYAQLPLRKWKVYLRGSVGAMFPNDWEFYAEQDGSNGVMIKGTTNTTDAIKPALLGGIGLSYNLNRFVIGIESGVLAYKPEFEIDLNGSPGSREEWIATLNQTISLGYEF